MFQADALIVPERGADGQSGMFAFGMERPVQAGGLLRRFLTVLHGQIGVQLPGGLPRRAGGGQGERMIKADRRVDQIFAPAAQEAAGCPVGKAVNRFRGKGSRVRLRLPPGSPDRERAKEQGDCRQDSGPFPVFLSASSSPASSHSTSYCGLAGP